MIWKKSFFSYITWFLYMFMVGIGLVVSLAGLFTQLGYSPMIGLFIDVAVLTGGGLFLRFWQRKAQNESLIKSSFETEFLKKLEICTVGVLFFVGVILRVVAINKAPADHAYYRVARIAADLDVADRVHGIDHLYVQLLHKLFYLFGNKIMAAYALQLILQMGGLLVGYFAVKKLSGYFPAIAMTAFGVLSPEFLAEVCELSPRMLYFFMYTAVLWLLGSLLKSRPERKKIWCLTGAIIGVLIYLDITGIGLLFVLIAGVFLLKEEDAEETQIPFAGLFAGIGGCLVGILGAMIVDSFASHTEISRVFWANIRLYIPDFPGLNAMGFLMNANLELIVLLVIMSIGIFSFQCNQKTDSGCVWVLLCVFSLVGMVLGYVPEIMNSPFWLYFYMSVLAGVGVQNIMKLFKFEFGGKRDSEDVSLPPPEEKLQKKTEGEPGKVVTVEVDGQKKEVKLLDNPLPVPKKKIRKAMDYDIEVSEDDDYDIK